MEKIKRANPKAYDFWVRKDPKTWSRAFSNEGVCCEAVENGFSECFNFVLVTVRHKPIITMLESIRVIIMERLNTMRSLMEKWTGDICLNIQKLLELSKDQQRFWHVIPSGGNKFEVRKGCDAFKVDEPNRTCSCQMWQISGLPCCHAIACIFKLNKMVEEYVRDCFRKGRYMLTYSQYMQPVDSIEFWPDCSNLSRILGPIRKPMPGRTRKKRVRAAHEPSSTRISKAGVVMTCQNCGQLCHNKKGCHKEPTPPVPRQKGKGGRPKKKQNVEPSLVDEHDIPTFVNNDINEFEMGETNMRGRFSDGRVFCTGRMTNKRRGGGGGRKIGHLKMRGGKTSYGRLLPAERVTRMGTWLAMDGGSSDTIEEQQHLNASMPHKKQVDSNAQNIPGTQKSTVGGSVGVNRSQVGGAVGVNRSKVGGSVRVNRSEVGGSVGVSRKILTRSKKAAQNDIVETRILKPAKGSTSFKTAGPQQATKQQIPRKSMSPGFATRGTTSKRGGSNGLGTRLTRVGERGSNRNKSRCTTRSKKEIHCKKNKIRCTSSTNPYIVT